MTKNQRLAKVALHLIAEGNNQITLESYFWRNFWQSSASKIVTKISSYPFLLDFFE
jgi:hypothetical protein